MVQSSQPDDLLTVHEVATHLRVDDTTVRRWIQAGALAAIVLPRKGERRAYRIHKATLEALLNASPSAPSTHENAHHGSLDD